MFLDAIRLRTYEIQTSWRQRRTFEMILRSGVASLLRTIKAGVVFFFFFFFLEPGYV